MSDDNDFMARYGKLEQARAAVWPANKRALFAILVASRITHIVVTFDGCGDSGQIEDMAVKARDNNAELPAAKVSYQDFDWQTEQPVAQEITVREAVENLVYECLRQTHEGWENNAGAYGEVIFDVATEQVTLDYNERIETSEFYQHIL